MCPMTPTWAPVVFAGLFFVSARTLPRSQSDRSVAERVFPVRSNCRRTFANSRFDDEQALVAHPRVYLDLLPGLLVACW